MLPTPWIRHLGTMDPMGWSQCFMTISATRSPQTRNRVWRCMMPQDLDFHRIGKGAGNPRVMAFPAPNRSSSCCPDPLFGPFSIHEFAFGHNLPHLSAWPALAHAWGSSHRVSFDPTTGPRPRPDSEVSEHSASCIYQVEPLLGSQYATSFPHLGSLRTSEVSSRQLTYDRPGLNGLIHWTPTGTINPLDLSHALAGRLAFSRTALIFAWNTDHGLL